MYSSPEAESLKDSPDLSQYEMECPWRYLFVSQILCGNECILKNLNVGQAQYKHQREVHGKGKELSLTQMWDG